MKMDELAMSDWLEAKRCLEEAIKDRKHPFHLVSLATISPEGPSCRKVVLRHFCDVAQTLGFHADFRSAKVQELTSDSRCSLLFYSKELSLQVRASGAAKIHSQDEICQQAWQKTGRLSRRCYLSLAGPGALLDSAGSGLPAEVEHQQPDWDNSEAGFVNFSVIRIHVTSWDLVRVIFGGSRRCKLKWSLGEMESQWLAP